MVKKTLKRIEEKYDSLRYALTEGYPRRNQGHNELDDFLTEDEYCLDSCVIEPYRDLAELLGKELKFDTQSNSPKILDNTEPIISKSWFIIFELFDLTGESLVEWVQDLLKCDPDKLLLEIDVNLKNIFTAENHSQAMSSFERAVSQIRVMIRLCEQNYRTNNFKDGGRHVEGLRNVIFKNLIPGENKKVGIEYLSLLMRGLTEDTLVELQENRLLTPDNIFSRMGVTAGAPADRPRKTGRIKSIPAEGEEFLSLISRVSLCNGKFLIRNNNFYSAEKLLGESMKSMAAWKQIKVDQLVLAKKANNLPDNLAKEIDFINNYTVNRSAVAQVYLGFCYYRQGRFSRSIAQIIPGRLILGKSNWLFSRIFADIMFASAERRLAGIHNTLQLEQSRRINENIIKFFENRAKKTAHDDDGTVERDPTFLLRAKYELGTNHYYNAEVRESFVEILAQNDSDSEQQTHEDRRSRLAGAYKDIVSDLRKAEKLADEIEKFLEYVSGRIYLGLKMEHFDLFWRANAYHLLAFVSLKKALLRSKIQLGKDINEPSREKITKLFAKAVELIGDAETVNLNSGSWWQKVEISSDKAFILNAVARFYSNIGDKVRKKSYLKKALKALEEAERFAEKMAKKEKVRGGGNPTIRSNFAGPIFLFRAQSYALYEDKRNAELNFQKWQLVSNEVEFARVRDLAHEIKNAIDGIDEVFRLDNDSGDSMEYKKIDLRFREWLLDQITKDKTDEEAIKLLEISKATFYHWKKQFAENAERRDEEERRNF